MLAGVTPVQDNANDVRATEDNALIPLRSPAGAAQDPYLATHLWRSCHISRLWSDVSVTPVRGLDVTGETSMA